MPREERFTSALREERFTSGRPARGGLHAAAPLQNGRRTFTEAVWLL
jgi:hypothetical protein